MNDAFAAWSREMPAENPVDLERTWEGIHALLNSPSVATAPISTGRLEPFAETVLAPAICDPASFRDPEHNVRTIVDCEDACSGKPPQKGRLLPKRGLNRRLTEMPAGGDDLTESITSQAHRSSAGSSDGTRKLTGRILPKSANRVVAPLQVTLPQLMPPPQQTTPAQVSAGSFRKESRVSIYDQRRQPETGAVLQDMEVDSRIPFVTPREVRDIDLVLNGQGRVENQEIWLHRQLEYVSWMWTAPYQPKVSVSLMRQVVSQEPRLRPSEENRAFPPARRTLPRICDAPSNAPRDVTAEDKQAEDCDTGAGVWGEALHGEREVAQVATVQTRMAPSTCPAGQRTPPPHGAVGAHMRQHIYLPQQRRG